MDLARRIVVADPASFNIAPCPSDSLALTNRLVVHGGDFPPEVEFIIVRNKYILSIM